MNLLYTGSQLGEGFLPMTRPIAYRQSQQEIGASGGVGGPAENRQEGQTWRRDAQPNRRQLRQIGRGGHLTSGALCRLISSATKALMAK